MRADRLLSILMLLQTRGLMTARVLADELEVSERTIYRDVEALGMSGVPVYTEHGPGGGFGLLDSYRTNLTGLNASELQALFALSIPAPLTELGLRQDLQSALLKLSASLPADRRKEEERMRRHIHLDWESWATTRQPTPFLEIVHQAVFTDRQLLIRYHLYFGLEVENRVNPLGMVGKAGEWYLVCDQNNQTKVHGIADLLYAEICHQPSLRPVDFNLEVFWQEYCRQLKENRPSYPVTIRVRHDALKELERITGQKTETIPSHSDPAGETEFVEAKIMFTSLDNARRQLMSLGGAVEVMEPTALRLSLIDFAEQIRKKYTAA